MPTPSEEWSECNERVSSWPSLDRGNTPSSPLLGERSWDLLESGVTPLPADMEAPLTEDAMLAIEAAHCRERVRVLRALHPQESNLRQEPVGLALSGGGTRAAAFHCGVLWALADAGVLKEVMHLSATSGGGYTAASFMTHLYQMSAEGDVKCLDDWYKQVVMRTVRRMQHNINYVVDTTLDRLFRLPQMDKPEEAGTSIGPRIFDLPLLIGALIGSVVASPVMLIVHTMWPIVLHIELHHAGRLRSVWCDPTREPWDNESLTAWLWSCLGITAAFSLVSILLNLSAWLGCCKVRKNSPKRHLAYRSLRQIAERCTVFYIVYAVLVFSVLWLQVREFQAASVPADAPTLERDYVRALCRRYVADASGQGGPTCSDRAPGNSEPWYSWPGAQPYLNETWVQGHARLPKGLTWDQAPPFVQEEHYARSLQHAMIATLGLSGLILLGVVTLLIGSTLLRWLLTVVIPVAYLFIVASVARWKIFGPITGQTLLFKGTSYSPELSTRLFVACVVCVTATLPVYDSVLKLSHLYYRRALKRAFFYGGRDVSDAALVTSPYCPNMVLGACLHDYRPPGEDSNFCDFSISSFFLGCKRTGYFYTPSQARLAHLMTVAGAATDASLLISLDILLIRFLLAVLSLRFGDFLRLEPEGETAVRVSRKIKSGVVRVGKAVKMIFPKGRLKMKRLKRYISEDHDRHWLQRGMQGLFDRMPAAFPFLISQLLLLVGVLHDNGAGGCRLRNGTLRAAFLLFYITLALSFFAYFRPLQFLIRSPMVQQFHMMAMHVYVAPSPPPYLYVSDGGLLEVLGILPLLRRRLRRIIVSDAAEDPRLTMRCLRDAAVLARKERLCSFFDPRDPRRDLEFVLQDLPTSGQATLHLGIRYEAVAVDGQCSDEPEVIVGDLFYVRMRLLPGDNQPVRSLLTEEELLLPPRPASASPEPGAGPRRLLGGTCMPWCECGGFCAGRQFPHYNMSNQFLTPLHFANLCGLAAELCQPLVRDLREHPPPPPRCASDEDLARPPTPLPVHGS